MYQASTDFNCMSGLTNCNSLIDLVVQRLRIDSVHKPLADCLNAMSLYLSLMMYLMCYELLTVGVLSKSKSTLISFSFNLRDFARAFKRPSLLNVCSSNTNSLNSCVLWFVNFHYVPPPPLNLNTKCKVASLGTL